MLKVSGKKVVKKGEVIFGTGEEKAQQLQSPELNCYHKLTIFSLSEKFPILLHTQVIYPSSSLYSLI